MEYQSHRFTLKKGSWLYLEARISLRLWSGPFWLEPSRNSQNSHSNALQTTPNPFAIMQLLPRTPEQLHRNSLGTI